MIVIFQPTCRKAPHGGRWGGDKSNWRPKDSNRRIRSCLKCQNVSKVNVSRGGLRSGWGSRRAARVPVEAAVSALRISKSSTAAVGGNVFGEGARGREEQNTTTKRVLD